MVRGECDIDEKLARIFAAMQKWNFLQLKAAQDLFAVPKDHSKNCVEIRQHIFYSSG